MISPFVIKLISKQKQGFLTLLDMYVAETANGVNVVTIGCLKEG